jgi:hypothetical protein
MLATPLHAVKKWRPILFSILAVLLALFFILGEVGLLTLAEPWVLLIPTSSAYHPEMHRWHDAVWGAFAGLLLGGSLLVLAWQGQRKPLLAQYFVLAALVHAVMVAVIVPSEYDDLIATVGLLVIFLLIYPTPRTLFSLAPAGRINVPSLALSILAAVLLAPDIWHNIFLQIVDKTSEHGQNLHWVTSAAVDITLVIAGLLTCTKRPGWKSLSIITGITFVYLGLATLAVPNNPGSWGTIGGMIAVLVGIGFLATVLYETRQVSLLAANSWREEREQPASVAAREKQE